MKFLSLEGLAYLYQQLKAKFDSLSGASHTHENKKLLDRIQQNEQVHQHSNMSVLQTITQDQVNNWQDSDRIAHYHNNKAVLDTITQELYFNWCEGYSSSVYSTEKINQMQSAITVYVNAAAGSDSNNGSTAETAFATLGKALSAVSYYKSATIFLAAGTYSIPDKELSLTCSYLTIIGNAAADTVIKGNISMENSYLKLSNVTLDCTDTEYANTSATAPFRILSGSRFYLESAVVSTVTQFCISATTLSNVYCFKTAFSGCTTYAVQLTADVSATIYRCTDESGKGLNSSYGCRAYLINSPNFSYKSGLSGMVYVDGQQVLPQTAEAAAVLSMGGNA